MKTNYELAESKPQGSIKVECLSYEQAKGMSEQYPCSVDYLVTFTFNHPVIDDHISVLVTIESDQSDSCNFDDPIVKVRFKEIGLGAYALEPNRHVNFSGLLNQALVMAFGLHHVNESHDFERLIKEVKNVENVSFDITPVYYAY